jgi:hypothetical protein
LRENNLNKPVEWNNVNKQSVEGKQLAIVYVLHVTKVKGWSEQQADKPSVEGKQLKKSGRKHTEYCI